MDLNLPHQLLSLQKIPQVVFLRLVRNKKRDNSIDTTAFQELLQISPDIFEEFVLDDLISKKSAPVKEKGVPKRKIPLDWYRVGWE